MTIRSYLRQAAFAVMVVAVAPWVPAQRTRTVTIDPSGESNLVYLSPVDPTAERNFARMFEIPIYRDYKSFALLLTNSSGRAIVAVTIRWTGTAAGRSGAYVHDSSTDSLRILSVSGGGAGSVQHFPIPRQEGSMAGHGGSWSTAEGSVVASDGERMLVSPGMFVREDVTGQRTSPNASSGINQKMMAADLVSARLDTVVLENGRVLGPDESRTVDELRARKAAIDNLLKAVIAAERRGLDGLDVLRLVADDAATGRSDPETLRQARLARMLMRVPHWREQLEKMAAMQLPNFYR